MSDQEFVSRHYAEAQVISRTRNDRAEYRIRRDRWPLSPYIGASWSYTVEDAWKDAADSLKRQLKPADTR